MTLTAEVGSIEALAGTRARLGASDEEQRAAVTAVAAALTHPLYPPLDRHVATLRSASINSINSVI